MQESASLLLSNFCSMFHHDVPCRVGRSISGAQHLRVCLLTDSFAASRLQRLRWLLPRIRSVTALRMLLPARSLSIFVFAAVAGVSIGGIIGHALCTGLAVVGGKLLAARISGSCRLQPRRTLTRVCFDSDQKKPCRMLAASCFCSLRHTVLGPVQADARARCCIFALSSFFVLMRTFLNLSGRCHCRTWLPIASVRKRACLKSHRNTHSESSSRVGRRFVVVHFF